MLTLATFADIDVLLDMILAYHQFEQIQSDHTVIKETVKPLLIADNPLGRIWLVMSESEPVGYIAVTFGYSIETGGRDALIDEFFIRDAHRGHGLGKQTLQAVKDAVRQLGMTSLYLEVARDNLPAQKLYAALGFEKREKYFLMDAPIA